VVNKYPVFWQKMWLYGYGSLMWYTNFDVERVVHGYVRGYARRFWQASPDHRGTHEKPGRTVTLVEDADSEVLGTAYLVPQQNVDDTVRYLLWREKAGYVTHKVMFYPIDRSGPFELEVFISPPNDNPHFIGPESLKDIAETVILAHGPSGSNVEYVMRLAHSVRAIDPNASDAHLFDLANEVLRLCAERRRFDKVLVEYGYVGQNL